MFGLEAWCSQCPLTEGLWHSEHTPRSPDTSRVAAGREGGGRGRREREEREGGRRGRREREEREGGERGRREREEREKERERRERNRERREREGVGGERVKERRQ